MAADTPTDAEADVMARYGIACMTVTHYSYKTWRYTRLSDAVAQAKREEAAAGTAS